MSIRSPLLLGFLLAASSAGILFSTTVKFPFFYDDIYYVQKNPAIRSVSLGSFLKPFSPVAPGLYRPVTTISFAKDYALFGMRPFGYHLSNILLHAAISGLVFLLAWQLLRSVFAAGVTALLFALHPVHTEAVTWIAGRSELLAAFFTLLSLLFFLHFRKTEAKKSFFFIMLSGIAYFLALSSKEIAAPLPLALLLLEGDQALSKKKKYTPYAAFVLAVILYVALRFTALGTLSVPLEHIRTAGLSLWGRMLLMAPIILHYVQLLFFPWGLRIEYDWVEFSPLIIGASSAIIAMIVAFGIWCLRTGRHTVAPLHTAGVGILWFFLFLLPVSNIMPIGEIVAERFLYLPSFGFCLFIGALVQNYVGSSRVGPRHAVPLLFVLAIFSFLTLQRNNEWKDPETLWRATLERSPNAPHALENLSSILLAKGETGEAGALIDRARTLWPMEPTLLALKAQWHFGRGEADAGRALLEEALRIATPEHIAFTDIHRGPALLALGRFEEALVFFENAVSRNPSDAVLHNNLGIAQIQLWRLEEAKRSFETAIALLEAQGSLTPEDERNLEGARENLDLLIY